MGRSEDAPIVSEWGATKRRSEALQDDTCETMIVAELQQRLVFFSVHVLTACRSTPSSLKNFGLSGGPRRRRARPSQQQQQQQHDSGGDFWRRQTAEKDQRIESTKRFCITSIGCRSQCGNPAVVIVPGEPFSSFLSCQIRASAIVVVVWESKWCSWCRVRSSRLIVCIHVQGHGLGGPCLLTEAWAC